MGIGINVNTKQDYSYLFQGLSKSSGSSMGNLNFLSDYAAIKNGSYGKLMKAYYAKPDIDKKVTSVNDKKDTKSTSTAADTSETLAKVQKSADNLKESADALIKKGKDSLFAEEDITTTDEIYGAVSEFVKDYNSLLDSADDVNSTSILNKAISLVNLTAANEKLLGNVGITINEDNSLSVDEKAFKSANMTTVKNLFNGNGSYAYRVSSQASLIDFAADNESSKANTYTMNGTYSNNYSMGNIMDTLF